MKIAVAIPSYKVQNHVLDVIARMPPQVRRIYVIDDKCPNGSGELVRQQCSDPRVRVIFHEENQGVGGAVRTGYQAALDEGMDIVVKVDGDGQMDPALIPRFTRAIERGQADYTKGNRFHRPESLQGMPPVRLFGNAVLSFIAKFSTGYWDLFDSTNGYVAAHHLVLRQIPLDRVARRYFFESDLLYHLYLVRAVVHEVPMSARYEDEHSSLRPGVVWAEFAVRHARNILRRFFYTYFLRDFSPASVELLVAPPAITFGAVFGAWRWIELSRRGEEASAGTVMLAALPIILGVQMLLSFLNFDVQHVPRVPRARERD